MGSLKLVAAVIGTIVVAGIGIDWLESDSRSRLLWQQAIVPGVLSQSHAQLSNHCDSCHVSVKGVEPARCIACHADNTALLQRQPTAFHANVPVCSGCHVEHQGTQRMPTAMDHSLLAKVGHRQLKTISGVDAAPWFAEARPHAEEQTAPQGAADAQATPPSAQALSTKHPRLDASESMLDCFGCHATEDRHQGLFGADCVQCHATTQWTVVQFVHPSTRSTECAQCHQPPPSHGMLHFSMLSASIARQPGAKVRECFLCHQTTSWNDIRGVGRVKHH